MKRYFTFSAISKASGLSKTSLVKAAKAGNLKAYKSSADKLGRWMTTEEDFEAYMASLESSNVALVLADADSKSDVSEES